MSIVMGINCSGFHSSACLFIDGKFMYAICEERLSRIKQDKTFPLRAINYCCESAGISFSEVEQIFVGWHPRFYINKSDNILNEALKYRGKLSYLTLNELATLSSSSIEDVSQCLRSGKSNLQINYIDHHKAHAAGSFFNSGFDKTDVLVLDGFGEISCGLVGEMNRKEMNIFQSHRTPHSLGLFYAAFTDFLGFKPYSDEWKVMALSSLGDPERYYPFIKSLIKIEGINLEIDLSYFEFYMFYTPRHFANKLCRFLGDPVSPGTEPSQRDYDIVAAVQRVVEEAVFDLLINLYSMTREKNLVLSGGFFMNSVLNGKIHENSPYSNLYIGGSPDDSGISIGSALYGINFSLGEYNTQNQLNHNYFGRIYTDAEVLTELRRRKIRFTELEQVAMSVAKLISDNKIIGFFQGKSEFGQRALGNRSILANPTSKAIKDIVNSTVKYREFFRPFAPAVIAERQSDIFEVTDTQTSFFMEKVFKFKPQWREKVPAVVHFDGTGRLQTVTKEINKAFYDILFEFDKITSVPIILNTSLNINGMPLVETPGDALDCFYQSGLDAIVLNRFLVEK
jgi:carbamoyltransferase